MAHQAGAYHDFCSTEQLRVFFAQEHNAMFRARAQTWTDRSKGEGTNHETHAVYALVNFSVTPFA